MVRIKFTTPVQVAKAKSTTSAPTTKQIAQKLPLAVKDVARQYREIPQEQTNQEQVASATALKQKQSLEMVQIMLHVSVSSFFFFSSSCIYIYMMIWLTATTIQVWNIVLSPVRFGRPFIES